MSSGRGFAVIQGITGALLLYNDKTMILARDNPQQSATIHNNPQQMITNANKCKRKDESGLKWTKKNCFQGYRILFHG